jgi:hypothetical protein
MITGAALAGWLGDPARQEASARASQELARRWFTQPIIYDLEREIAAVPNGDGAGLLAATERFMASAAPIEGMIQEMIAAASADPFFRPPFLFVNSDINVGLILYSEPRVTISLGVASADALAAKKSGVRGPKSIIFTGLLSSFHWLRSGGATISLWEAPAAEANFVADPDLSCRSVGRRKLEDGDHFTMDGSRQSFVIEHATSDMICLQATVHDGSPLLVEYDSKTLRFVGASSADEASSRLELMVSLLRLLDRADAAPTIAALLDEPHFFTRWHVMRELLALDADLARPHLERMAESDPHPDVRARAKETLDLFFREEEAA